jgi:tetratricopeptide (TPR) repeat protein
LSTGGYEDAKAHFDDSLRISLEVGNKRREGRELAHLGRLSYLLKRRASAVANLNQAIEIAQELGDLVGLGYALTSKGHLLVELEHFDKSVESFQKAIRIRQELGQNHLEVESLAGMAYCYFEQGDLHKAKQAADKVLDALDENNLDGVDDRFQIYLTCYRILEAQEDPRALSLLTRAYHLLQEQVRGIADGALRESFMRNVRSNREIIAAYEAITI